MSGSRAEDSGKYAIQVLNIFKNDRPGPGVLMPKPTNNHHILRRRSVIPELYWQKKSGLCAEDLKKSLTRLLRISQKDRITN
jgi:hypothetical protein